MKAFACIFGIMLLATGLGAASEQTYGMAAARLLIIAVGAALLMYGLARTRRFTR